MSPIVSVRISADDLAKIEGLAHQAGVSRSAYLVRSGLDGHTPTDERLEKIEKRLGAIERALKQLEGQSRYERALGLSERPEP